MNGTHRTIPMPVPSGSGTATPTGAPTTGTINTRTAAVVVTSAAARMTRPSPITDSNRVAKPLAQRTVTPLPRDPNFPRNGDTNQAD